MRRFTLLALLFLVSVGRADDAPKWQKLTAAKWREIINETYGPPSHWDANELFRHYVRRALTGTPAGYKPRYKPRRYNGTEPEMVGALGRVNVLVDVPTSAYPLNLAARQQLKSMIDWLNEERTKVKGGEVSHGVLLIVSPQPVTLPKAGAASKEAALFPPLPEKETSVVEFSRSPGRRVFVFHATAEYLKRGTAYTFRVGPAGNLTGELTDIKGAKIKRPEPLPKDKGTPEDGVPVKKEAGSAFWE